MALINDTHFVDECFLAGLSDGIVRQRLLNYIAGHENDFLQMVFGDFGVQFILPANSNIARYVYLIENYLRYAETRYVYYGYVDDLNATATHSGKGAMKSENAVKVRPDIAMVKAWNQMVNKLQLMYRYMIQSGDYPELVLENVTPFYVKNTSDL